jgi:hypothetical protein
MLVGFFEALLLVVVLSLSKPLQLPICEFTLIYVYQVMLKLIYNAF